MNKQDFPILDGGLVYLDNSATTQKPKKVIDVVQSYYENSNANIHRGIYHLSEKSTILYEQAREKIAKFIGAESIVFTSGTTQSLNMIAKMIDLKEGDEIVLSEMEHHSNLVPWQEVAKVKGCEVKFIPIKEDFNLDMNKAKELVGEKTKVVSITHMSNVLGAINPVKEIVNLAHEVGAVCVIDAAQSVPHLKVDVKELDCDFLVFSGHKMFGPTGIGVMYGKNMNDYQPVNYGGGMVKEVTLETTTFQDSPERFESGTPNIAGAIGLMAAIEYIEEIGIDNIKAHTDELSNYFIEKIKTVPKIKLIGPLENRGPVFSFTIDNIHPHDVAEVLNSKKIAVRAGHHCAMPLMNSLGISGTARASFYLYNTKEDVDLLIAGLEKVMEKLG